MSTVRTTVRRRWCLARAGEWSTAWRLGALVAVLVLGILGMHALASYGTQASADSSSGRTSMIGMEGRMAGVGAAGQPGDWFRVPANQTDEAGVWPAQPLGTPPANPRLTVQTRGMAPPAG